MRFKTSDQALQVASILKARFSVFEELSVPVEEFPVQVRLLISGRHVMIQLYVFLFRFIIGGFILAFLSGFGLFGIVLGTTSIVTYIGLPFWVVFVKARRPTPGWLRFKGTTIVVRTGSDWVWVLPKVIEWKTPESFVLKSNGSKYELSFQAAQSASRASMMLKTAIPMIQERHAEAYSS
ncbi:MAG TPA: hypothetical protein VGS11_07415 [Candidatus Bathyarchaeia archaeon]|nr:hypothetical protein [Candidatus Bathyarchaeia archaeon]